MDIITILLIAIGLSMDAFAVSVTSGFAVERLRIKHAFRMALFFGGFQFLMPILGWFTGLSLKDLITGIDHWVAFVLLFFIGAKMIYESTKMESEKGTGNAFKLGTLFLLAIATSIDALAVGISLSFLNVAIVSPSIVIGVVTFLLTFAGVYIGKKFGHFFESKLEIAGGLILIGLGFKILIQHLWM